jgi:sugar phosphate isomerase/epimerase
MKFAICNEIFQNWKLADTFAYAKKAGYDGVEIAPFTIAKDVTTIGPGDRASIRALAHQCQIELSGIHWVLAHTEGLHLTDPDPGVRARTSRYLSALVDFCADLSARYMIVGSPKQRNLAPGISKEQGSAWTIECFAPAVRQAEDRGVTICFEPLAPVETNFINTAAEAIELTRRLNSPHFQIILDVKAMSSEATPIPAVIRASWPHFAYFHANDKNLKGPGFGEVDFRPIAAALKEAGYDGWVSVEVFRFEEGPEIIASRSIDYLRRTFELNSRPNWD